MPPEEKDLDPTLRAVTKQLVEHNRVLGILKLKLEPVLNDWKENAENLVGNLDLIASALKELVALSTKDVEEDAKRKEDIIQKAGGIVAARIDAWIASAEGQEAITGTIGDVFEGWRQEMRVETKELLRKEREKDVREPGPETHVPAQSGADTTAGAPGPEKV